MSHLSSGSAESSKIVPTLQENCLREWVVLRSHMRRVEMKRMSLLPQVEHSTPLGQRRSTMKLRQLSGSEKYRMACWSVLGFCMASSMKGIYHARPTESSILLPSQVLILKKLARNGIFGESRRRRDAMLYQSSVPKR